MFEAIFSLVVLGDYTSGMYALFGIDEDSRIVDVVLTVRSLIVG